MIPTVLEMHYYSLILLSVHSISLTIVLRKLYSFIEHFTDQKSLYTCLKMK